MVVTGVVDFPGGLFNGGKINCLLRFSFKRDGNIRALFYFYLHKVLSYVFLFPSRFSCGNDNFQRFRADGGTGNIRIESFNLKTVFLKFFR